MKTEKSAAALANTLQESTRRGTKWLQNVNHEFIKSQNEQLQFGKKLFREAIDSVQHNGKAYSTKSATGSGDMFMEQIQKNIETWFNIAKLTANKTLGRSDGKVSTKLIENALNGFDSLANQFEVFSITNQNNFDLLFKQLEASKDAMVPLTEEIRRELIASYELSKENLQAIMDSYMEIANATIEANQDQLDEAVSLMNENVSDSLRNWEGIVSEYSDSKKENIKKTKVDAAKKGNSSDRKHVKSEVSSMA